MEGSSSSNSRRYRIHMAASNFIQAPLTALFDYSGLLGGARTGGSRESEEFISGGSELPSPTASGHCDPETPRTAAGIHHEEAISIRIIDNVGESNAASDTENGGNASPPDSVATIDGEGGGGIEGGLAEGFSAPPIPIGGSGSASVDGNRDTSHQRYDIQHVARWIEQILPFSLLLLVVFLRQHLQGFFVTIWISAIMFKSNDILRKQTALKGERETSVLVGITAVFILHVVCIYWWYQNDDLLYPLVLLPPKAIPPFWHALFIITVNDTMARQAAMVFKSILLMYYKNSRGPDYRRQGQILTLIEYMLLLYRALLPTPVWYRFFLNKEYGSLFSSITTGLYLTFKLTSVIEKVRFFLTALRALSRKEVHYGSYATSEEVNAAGDLCAICQEKMQSPILLRCKHIFCEDCVSEWFERERTCPLCRALVKPADIRSYADGSTSLFFQLF